MHWSPLRELNLTFTSPKSWHCLQKSIREGSRPLSSQRTQSKPHPLCRRNPWSRAKKDFHPRSVDYRNKAKRRSWSNRKRYLPPVLHFRKTRRRETNLTRRTKLRRYWQTIFSESPGSNLQGNSGSTLSSTIFLWSCSTKQKIVNSPNRLSSN